MKSRKMAYQLTEMHDNVNLLVFKDRCWKYKVDTLVSILRIDVLGIPTNRFLSDRRRCVFST